MASASPFRFTCTVSIEGFEEPFTSEDSGPQGSKQAARGAAAKTAVLHLRSQDLIPSTNTTTHESKRHKSSSISAATAAKYGGGTGLTQIMRDFHVSTPPSSSTTATQTPSLPQQIHELAFALGLQSPMWDVQSSRPATGSDDDAPRLPLWDVAAHFAESDVSRHPPLKGSVGQVWRVHGKERAKLESCERVLAVLEEVKRSMEKG